MKLTIKQRKERLLKDYQERKVAGNEINLKKLAEKHQVNFLSARGIVAAAGKAEKREQERLLAEIRETNKEARKLSGLPPVAPQIAEAKPEPVPYGFVSITATEAYQRDIVFLQERNRRLTQANEVLQQRVDKLEQKLGQLVFDRRII